MGMTNEDYKLTRNRARLELQNKLITRVRLDAEVAVNNKRIAELTQAVKALDLLVGDDGETKTDLMIAVSSQSTLADAVRELLRRSDVHLTAIEISRDLRRFGFKSEGYINPQASIHTMLKRLKDDGYADTIIKDGKTAYRLIPEG
jgi:hypothetical protein